MRANAIPRTELTRKSVLLEGPRARGLKNEAAVEDWVDAGSQSVSAHDAGDIALGDFLTDGKEKWRGNDRAPGAGKLSGCALAHPTGGGSAGVAATVAAAKVFAAIQITPPATPLGTACVLRVRPRGSRATHR